MQVQCKGCFRTFKSPTLFKGSHLIECQKLAIMGLGAGKERTGGPVNGQGQQMIIKANELDTDGYVKFVVSYTGLTWYTPVHMEEL